MALSARCGATAMFTPNPAATQSRRAARRSRSECLLVSHRPAGHRSAISGRRWSQSTLAARAASITARPAPKAGERCFGRTTCEMEQRRGGQVSNRRIPIAPQPPSTCRLTPGGKPTGPKIAALGPPARFAVRRIDLLETMNGPDGCEFGDRHRPSLADMGQDSHVEQALDANREDRKDQKRSWPAQLSPPASRSGPRLRRVVSS